MSREPRRDIANRASQSGVPAWMASLRQAAFDAVSESDITAIVAKQVEKAKEGDPAAVKLVFDLFLKGGPQSMTQNNVIIEAETPQAKHPTKAKAGTVGKLETLIERAGKGESLFHEQDA